MELIHASRLGYIIFSNEQNILVSMFSTKQTYKYIEEGLTEYMTLELTQSHKTNSIYKPVVIYIKEVLNNIKDIYTLENYLNNDINYLIKCLNQKLDNNNGELFLTSLCDLMNNIAKGNKVNKIDYIVVFRQICKLYLVSEDRITDYNVGLYYIKRLISRLKIEYLNEENEIIENIIYDFYEKNWNLYINNNKKLRLDKRCYSSASESVK